jgi:hypothetical protein
MGLLTDFFAASPEVAEAVDPENWMTSRSGFTLLVSGGIEPTVMLGVLEEVLTGVDFEETLDAYTRLSDSGSSWVYGLRPHLQDALAEKRDDWSQVAGACLVTGEMGAADADGLSEFLSNLSDFARDAMSAGKRVYCWGSV